jgi:hypothetical protein
MSPSPIRAEHGGDAFQEAIALLLLFISQSLCHPEKGLNGSTFQSIEFRYFEIPSPISLRCLAVAFNKVRRYRGASLEPSVPGLAITFRGAGGLL